MRLLALPTVAVLVAVVGSGTAHAATTVTQDKSAFLQSTGSRDISGAIPNSGVQESATLGQVTLTGAPSSDCSGCGSLNIGPDWTNLLPGNEIALSDVESFNVTTAEPTTALGFDFVEPTHPDPDASGRGCEVPSCVDSTFTVTLKSGGGVVGTVQFNGANDVATFIGIRSDAPFDRVEIRETSGTNDNEFFGRFYGNLDATPPDLKLSGKKTQKLGKHVVVNARCDEASSVVARGKLVVGGEAFGLKKATGSVAAGDKTTLKPKVPKKARKAARKALAHGKNVTAKLEVTATDAAGNDVTRRRKVKITL